MIERPQWLLGWSGCSNLAYSSDCQVLSLLSGLVVDVDTAAVDEKQRVATEAVEKLVFLEEDDTEQTFVNLKRL